MLSSALARTTFGNRVANLRSLMVLGQCSVRSRLMCGHPRNTNPDVTSKSLLNLTKSSNINTIIYRLLVSNEISATIIRRCLTHLRIRPPNPWHTNTIRRTRSLPIISCSIDRGAESASNTASPCAQICSTIRPASSRKWSHKNWLSGRVYSRLKTRYSGAFSGKMSFNHAHDAGGAFTPDS